MKDKEYKVYSFRINEETYLLLKELREFSNKSWNLFFKELINKKLNKKIKKTKIYYDP
jgi:predicted DNA-binding protein